MIAKKIKTLIFTIVCLPLGAFAYTQAELNCNNERQLINQHGYTRGMLQKLDTIDGERFFVVEKSDLAADQKYEQIVLVFHGGGGNGCMFRNAERTAFGKKKIASKPVIYIYPSGISSQQYVDSPLFEPNPVNQWNDGRDPNVTVDDVGFIRSILDKIKRESNTNIKYVFATGFSNGATFLYRLSAEVSEIDAIAPVSGHVSKGYIEHHQSQTGNANSYPMRPVHFFQISTVGDIMPYDDKPEDKYYGARDTFNMMKAVNNVKTSELITYQAPSNSTFYVTDDYADTLKWSYHINSNKLGTDLIEVDRVANKSVPEASHCWHGIPGEAMGFGCTGKIKVTQTVLWMFALYQDWDNVADY